MKRQRNYHHGGLRAALLTAARAKLASEGYEILSLRCIARDIGVAPSAPYAHFASRDALLHALMEEGAKEIRQRFAQAYASSSQPEQRLAAICKAYLDYAKEEPQLIRLLVTSPISTITERIADGFHALRIFERAVGETAGLTDRLEIRDVAFCCWSTIHGFAMLRLHDRLAAAQKISRTENLIIDRAVRQATAC